MKHLIVLVVVSGSLLTQAQTKQQSANIRGTVTDQSDTPVAGVTVYAVAQNLTLDDAIPRSAKTDSNGVFDFRGGLELGIYKLYAQKIAAGFPDPFDRFYADPKAEVPKVELGAAHPSANVKVKLGPQAATVAGRIIDAKTGATVNALLAFMDSEGHGHSVRVDNGNYRVLVPPGKSVTLMVTVLDPTSDHSMLPVAPLNLEPGQYVQMDLPVSSQ